MMPSSPARVDCRWGMAMCRLSGAAKTSPSLAEGAKSPCRLLLAGPWGPSISSTTRYSTRSSTAGSAGTSVQQLFVMALRSQGDSTMHHKGLAAHPWRQGVSGAGSQQCEIEHSMK